MYTVGLDKIRGLILYSQLSVTKTEISVDIKSKVGSNIPVTSGNIKEIIFGCLLGDGKLEMPPRGVNARFGFTQADFQKDYFLSVVNSLSGICSGKYRESSYLDKRTGKTYKSLSFWSKSLPLLNEFYSNFYADKVKVVPSDLSLLTPLALAHWVMQDGARGSSKGLYLCTDSFTHSEVKRLAEYLIDKYGIKCSIHKTGGNYRIFILVKSVETVKNLILPFMHSSFTFLITPQVSLTYK